MGKSSGSSPPAIRPTDTSQFLSQALSSYQSSMQNIMNQTQQSMAEQMRYMTENSINSLPEVIDSVGDIDWAERTSQLKQKAAADYNAKEALRRGRASTILTSPLLDDTDPATTSSILSTRS